MNRLIGMILLLTCAAVQSKAQQVESIEFHLYTDSLKKGVHNYINIDGKLADGSWRPLNSKLIQFSSSAGTWEGNNLIIDSSYKKDSVVVIATLRNNAALKKTITIYMKRNLAGERLKTEEELMNDLNDSGSKRRRHKG